MDEKFTHILGDYSIIEFYDRLKELNTNPNIDTVEINVDQFGI